MREGGSIIPAPREESDGKRRTSAILWGTVSVPPERHPIRTKKFGLVDELIFVVKCNKKQSQRMHVRPDNPFYHVANLLRLEDRVLVCGEYSESDYTKTVSEWDKTHKRKKYEDYNVGDQVVVTAFDMTPQWIVPEIAVTDPIAWQQRFLRPADPMFSAGDPDLESDEDEGPPETSWI